MRTLLREQIARDVFIYSVTLKPEQDSPRALRAYAEMHGVNDPNWLFLTGKPEEVDLLRHKIGFADPDPEVDRDKSLSQRHAALRQRTRVWGTCRAAPSQNGSRRKSGSAIPREFKKHAAVND